MAKAVLNRLETDDVYLWLTFLVDSVAVETLLRSGALGGPQQSLAEAC